MFESFLHPAYMAAGAALVSAPIIIHLINRMRFRRIRWAAMEFLLKSQKRNRRRLIIEQLILLLLRCLLIALAGFLVARFIGKVAGITGENSAVHLVVLDDTVSMTDRWKEEGDEKKAFDVAKQRVLQLAEDAAKANSPQRLKLVTLSQLGEQPLFDERLTDQSVSTLRGKLRDTDATDVHVKPVEALKWARTEVSEAPEPVRFLHFVSDMRDTDWSGAEADKLNEEIDGLIGNNTRVLLLDVAHPYRGERQPVVLNHDNMCILDLRPETRYAAEGLPVEFTLTVQNFSAEDRKNVGLDVRVNGEKRFDAPPTIDVPRASISRHTFLLSFTKAGYNQISATLRGEEAGVEADNTRVAVIEVRKQVPVLMIDGSEDTPELPQASFYLSTAFTVARGYEPVVKAPKELEDLDLSPYPCVYLLNVPQFTEKAIQKLEEYVRDGGRIAFFVGDKVRASHYRDELYKDGKGLMPVPLSNDPTPPLEAEEKLRRLFEDQYQVFFRDPAHPIFKEAAKPKYREVFKFLMVDRYWPTLPRFQWKSDPNRYTELVTLPNRRPVQDYLATAAELSRKIPTTEEKFAKYKASLEEHQRAIRNALGEPYLYVLGNAIDRLLNDRGDPSNPEGRPDLTEFWAQPEVQKLRADLNALRETVQYGDPLIVANRFGKGVAVTVLTTAGRSWNDWAGGCPASWTYPVIMVDLQRYLTGVGEESNNAVGTSLEVRLNAERYEDKARCFLQAPPAEQGENEGAEVALEDLGDVLGQVNDKQLTFSFANTREPGLYFLHLQPKPEAGLQPPPPEERAYVFNIDSAAEGNLKRVNTESVERSASADAVGEVEQHGQVTMVTPDMSLKEIVAPRRKDMSESPWLYLIILLILVVEQALAVHLSFHVRGGDAQTTAPGATAGRPAPAEAA